MKPDQKQIRAALQRQFDMTSHEAGAAPSLSQIYAPPGHEAALDPERTLVVGGRGMGKSFWSAVLNDESARAFVSQNYQRLDLENCIVRLGFSGSDYIAGGPPSREILDDIIIRDKVKPEVVWRAVILKWARQWSREGSGESEQTWRDAAKWVAEDAERIQSTLRSADQELSLGGKRLLIVFDALDRVGESWAEIRERTQALLRVALSMRSYRAIKIKIFMRSDQAADELQFAFPDASKLSAARVDLSWERRDLFALSYTVLARDAESADAFKEIVGLATGLTFRVSAGDPGDLPVQLKFDEELQETVFRLIAGRYMGIDRRRGKTYSWLHSHLADAHGQVSPRSFLTALSAAALHEPSPTDTAIDHRGIIAGMQKASELRVAQLNEEHQWIQDALRPLADLRVPCQDEELYRRWQEARTIEAIVASKTILPPIELSNVANDKPKALLEALRRIGVVEKRPDGRTNMPDIFRVAARLLRMGGVKPHKTA